MSSEEILRAEAEHGTECRSCTARRHGATALRLLDDLLSGQAGAIVLDGDWARRALALREEASRG